MVRKDIVKLVSGIRSDKAGYFDKALREMREILPASIKMHDRTTAEKLVAEAVRAYWYWDERVPRTKNWEKLTGKKLEEFVAGREEMRRRRDAVMELLMLAREAADHLRVVAHGDKKKHGLSVKIVRTVDACEMEWQLIAEKRVAEGEMGGKWVVRIG